MRFSKLLFSALLPLLSPFFSEVSLATELIIRLKNTASFAGVDLVTDRTARIRFVFERLRSTAESSQAPILVELRARGLKTRSFYIENAILVDGANADDVKWLENREDIRSVMPNPTASLAPFIAPSASDNENETAGHLRLIGADRVWKEFGVRGKGIVVAGQDTGYAWSHNALRRQYRGSSGNAVNHDYNWLDAFGKSDTPVDDTGHGTHTMGTAIGDDGGKNRIGVAPEARWIGCRNMLEGRGSLASYLSCFEFFLAPYPAGGDPRKDGRPDLAPHIVTNSWTCSPAEGCQGDVLLQAVRALKSAGIMVVAAAGNYGPTCGSIDRAPAKYSGEVLTVGAYNRYLDEVAVFSARGPSAWNGKTAPDLIAPGESIRSAVPGGIDAYDEKTGTSMATPQVAGAIALLWSARPELVGQIDRTIDLLVKTAKPIKQGDCGGGLPNNNAGHGLLDIYAAVSSAR